MPIILLSGGSGMVPIPAVTPTGPGYFTGFWPSFFTPFFPGSSHGFGPTNVPAPGLCPTGFFTGFYPGYFTQFWPGAGGAYGSVVPTPPLPGSFIAAVRRALVGDATLAGMLRGGVWKDKAPRGVPYPFIVYTEGSADPLFSTMDRDGMIPFTEHKTFNLNVYGTVAATAEVVARRIIRVLDDDPLVSVEGVTLEVRHDVGYQMIRTGETAYGGANLWQVIIPYEAMLQKLFPAR